MRKRSIFILLGLMTVINLINFFTSSYIYNLFSSVISIFIVIILIYTISNSYKTYIVITTSSILGRDSGDLTYEQLITILRSARGLIRHIHKYNASIIILNDNEKIEPIFNTISVIDPNYEYIDDVIQVKPFTSRGSVLNECLSDKYVKSLLILSTYDDFGSLDKYLVKCDPGVNYMGDVSDKCEDILENRYVK